MLLAASLCTFFVASLLQAHHSGSAYQVEPIWVQGAVVSFERANPHTITTLEARRDDGRVQRWLVEGPSMARLNRSAAELYFPEVGDVIRFCAFPYRPIDELQGLWPEVDFSTRDMFRIRETDDAVTQAVAGHVMFTPDGDRQAWELHGVLAACVRTSDDTPQSWLEFVNSGPWLAWCQQRQYAVVQNDPTLAGFVEEFNALLDNPCP